MSLAHSSKDAETRLVPGRISLKHPSNSLSRTLLARRKVEPSYYHCSVEPIKAIRLGRESELAPREKAEKTLLAINEFKRYLDGVEKDLSRMSKKFSNKEIAQGVGFAATGIHEALTYLGIVKKVIEKTERIVAKKSIVSVNETNELPQGPSSTSAP
jgi:hypothetical protein